MSKLIPLTQGKSAIVDDDDFEWLNQYKWAYQKSQDNEPMAAFRSIARGTKSKGTYQTKRVLMHRAITNCPSNMVVDHINHNVLDNRRCNLRICTYQQNTWNTIKRQGRAKGSKYIGVQYIVPKPFWWARMLVNGKIKVIGRYKTEKEAACAYNEAAKKYHGEFAQLNKV